MSELSQAEERRRALDIVSIMTRSYAAIMGLGFAFGFYMLKTHSIEDNITDALTESIIIGIASRLENHQHFFLSRVLAINLTTLAFSKILALALYNLFLGMNDYTGFSLFAISQVVYHTGEFFFVLRFHVYETTWNSYLINHSWAYNIAIVSCMIEYFVELHFVTWLKQQYLLIWIAVLFNIVGQYFRIAAQQTAKSNFTHLVADEKVETHELVTHGVYSIARHPSYLGFFIATLANQMMLVNPICFVGYIFVLWNFFYNRIMYEEWTLKEFFGEEYVKYAARTPIWIPFIQSKINERYNKFQ